MSIPDETILCSFGMESQSSPAGVMYGLALLLQEAHTEVIEQLLQKPIG